MSPFLLLAIGLVLILLEFFIPGAVMGIMGGILLLAGAVIAGMQGTGMELLLYLFFMAAGLAVVIKFALWYIPRTAKKDTLFLNKDQQGFKASAYDASAIGKQGVVISDLKPGGHILVEGQKHQAISVAGYISKGERVEVISGQEESLLVKPANEERL